MNCVELSESHVVTLFSYAEQTTTSDLAVTDDS